MGSKGLKKKEYYSSNQEKLKGPILKLSMMLIQTKRAVTRASYSANPEKRKQPSRARCSANREKQKQASRDSYSANPEKQK